MMHSLVPAGPTGQHAAQEAAERRKDLAQGGESKNRKRAVQAAAQQAAEKRQKNDRLIIEGVKYSVNKLMDQDGANDGFTAWQVSNKMIEDWEKWADGQARPKEGDQVSHFRYALTARLNHLFTNRAQLHPQTESPSPAAQAGPAQPQGQAAAQAGPAQPQGQAALPQAQQMIQKINTEQPKSIDISEINAKSRRLNTKTDIKKVFDEKLLPTRIWQILFVRERGERAEFDEDYKKIEKYYLDNRFQYDNIVIPLLYKFHEKERHTALDFAMLLIFDPKHIMENIDSQNLSEYDRVIMRAASEWKTELESKKGRVTKGEMTEKYERVKDNLNLAIDQLISKGHNEINFTATSKNQLRTRARRHCFKALCTACKMGKIKLSFTGKPKKTGGEYDGIYIFKIEGPEQGGTKWPAHVPPDTGATIKINPSIKAPAGPAQPQGQAAALPLAAPQAPQAARAPQSQPGPDAWGLPPAARTPQSQPGPDAWGLPPAARTPQSQPGQAAALPAALPAALLPAAPPGPAASLTDKETFTDMVEDDSKMKHGLLEDAVVKKELGINVDMDEDQPTQRKPRNFQDYLKRLGITDGNTDNQCVFFSMLAILFDIEKENTLTEKEREIKAELARAIEAIQKKQSTMNNEMGKFIGKSESDIEHLAKKNIWGEGIIQYMFLKKIFEVKTLVNDQRWQRTLVKIKKERDSKEEISSLNVDCSDMNNPTAPFEKFEKLADGRYLLGVNWIGGRFCSLEGAKFSSTNRPNVDQRKNIAFHAVFAKIEGHRVITVISNDQEVDDPASFGKLCGTYWAWGNHVDLTRTRSDV